MHFQIRLSTRQKITIARILNRCIRLARATTGRPMHGKFRRQGLTWDLNLNEGIDFAIYLLGTFEHDLAKSYKRLIPVGSNVLDIGANIGAHTLPLAQHIGPTGQVTAIEATSYAYNKLRLNLSLNPQLLPRTTAIQALLTAEDNAIPEPAISSSWPLTGSEKTDAVLCGALRPTSGARTCTIDTLVQDLAIRKIEWIKLDVDGHELSVLQGGSRLLEEHKPAIFMELAPYCYVNSSTGFPMLIKLLVDAGYSFYKLPSQQLLPSSPEVLIESEIPHEGSINILAKRTG